MRPSLHTFIRRVTPLAAVLGAMLTLAVGDQQGGYR